MMRVLIIDNYDSFTFNLVQLFGELGVASDVVKNDEISAAQAAAYDGSAIVISPGPCTPNDAGISLEVIARSSLPMFGVCLGHQAIGQAFGGTVARANRRMHGRTSPIYHEQSSLFLGIESPFEATRYHSLIVDRHSLPDCLTITAWTEEGDIMALSHTLKPIHGVQFHPESILTTRGSSIVRNWVNTLRDSRVTTTAHSPSKAET